MVLSQRTLDGGTWKRIGDGYRLFHFEELMRGEMPMHVFRAVGDIPYVRGTSEPTERVSIVSEISAGDLVSMIDDYYGNSGRDEFHRYWVEDGTKIPMVAHNWIVDHPEVKAAVLSWRWPIRAVYDAHGLRYVTASGCTTYDPEYSFAGLRGALLDYLSAYDCWDHLIGDGCTVDACGVLRIVHTADYGDDYTEDSVDSPCLGALVDNDEGDVQALMKAELERRVKEGKMNRTDALLALQEAGFR